MERNLSDESPKGLALAQEAQPRWMTGVGYVLSGLPAVGLVMSAIMKFRATEEMVKMFTDKLGWPANALTGLGVLEGICVLFYLIPGTSVLGAILLTGYLGGAFASHLRTGEFTPAPLVIGVLLWGGLFLRDRRIRALIPWRSRPSEN